MSWNIRKTQWKFNGCLSLLHLLSSSHHVYRPSFFIQFPNGTFFFQIVLFPPKFFPISPSFFSFSFTCKLYVPSNIVPTNTPITKVRLLFFVHPHIAVSQPDWLLTDFFRLHSLIHLPIQLFHSTFSSLLIHWPSKNLPSMKNLDVPSC